MEVWKLPAEVYSRIITLRSGMFYDSSNMISLLREMQYRKVNHITNTGEFIVHNKNCIEIFRRSFDFPDEKENKIRVIVSFSKNNISEIRIKNTKKKLGFFRLDPILLTILENSKKEKRLFMPINNFPTSLIKTLITIEDRSFYNHNGVNLISMFRAFFSNIYYRKSIQGGSTLTQQLVKNLFLTKKRSIWRKLNEIYMAVIMEFRYSKNYILELYLNEVYLGQIGKYQIHGFALASLYYFRYPINEISLEKQAILISLVKGASLYNPWRNSDLLIKRRNFILKKMKENNIIDEKFFNSINLNSISVCSRNKCFLNIPSFKEILMQEIESKIGKKIISYNNIKIFTTLDKFLQNKAEEAVKNGIIELSKKNNINNLEAAMIIVDRFSGEIRSVVGSSNPNFVGFNRAIQARRPIGSLIKPAIYLTALSEPDKYKLNTWISDTPIHIKQPNGNIWSPKNFDKFFRGKVMLIDAISQSLNVPTVHLGLSIGINKIVNTLIQLGVSPSVINPLPSMLLGSINLTPIETIQMFQTISSGGNYSSLSSVRSIINKDGKYLYQSFPQSRKVVPEQAAYLTIYAMQQVAINGTSHILSKKFPDLNLAVKTGTTNNFKDSWFVGIDGQEVSIVWVGKDNNSTSQLTGSNGALFIYSKYLDRKKSKKLDLNFPISINYLSIDKFGEFVNSSSHSSIRKIPVWTDYLLSF